MKKAWNEEVGCRICGSDKELKGDYLCKACRKLVDLKKVKDVKQEEKIQKFINDLDDDSKSKFFTFKCRSCGKKVYTSHHSLAVLCGTCTLGDMI